MTSINIADTTKLGTLSTQIFEMLKEKGLHPTTESERVISFGQDPIYILGLDTEAEGNIFVHLYARYTTPHFSMNEKFELFNKINHTMKQVKISMVPGEEAVQISCGFWINHFGEFKTAFHRAFNSIQTAELIYAIQAATKELYF